MLEFHQAGTPSQVEYMRRNANAMALLMAATGENGVYTAAGAATATVTSQAKTVNTLTYRSGGVFKTKAGTDNFWTLTGATQPVSSFTKYLLMIDGAGAASVIVCSNAATALGSLLPITTSFGTKAVVATLTVATNGSTTFIPGTTLLGAAGITATFVDGFDATVLPWSYGTLTGLTPAGSGF
jgi:hypothetical protein